MLTKQEEIIETKKLKTEDANPKEKKLDAQTTVADEEQILLQQSNMPQILTEDQFEALSEEKQRTCLQEMKMLFLQQQ